MQGWAPYDSSAGILTSSIKIAILSLGRAPKRVLPFLLSFDSIANYVYLGLVWAEKFKKIPLMTTLSDLVSF